jgi:predicted glycosyltransferase
MTVLREPSLRTALNPSPPRAGEKIAINRRCEKDQPKVVRPIKILVYSHDTFGLGNIRRMIAICEHLKTRIPEISVLVLTGSPMLHSFRLIDGIDYVKLPCLRRDTGGAIGVKYLNLNLDSTVRLRREMILSTITYFTPDIFLVDKKPGGVAGELEESLRTLKTNLPNTAVVLLLRDILDDAAATIDQWRRQCAHELIQEYYHKILVVGLPELYDVCEEYQFPASLRAKVHFCGYVGREAGPELRAATRRQLGISESDRMILVTAGGGEDGFSLIGTYLEGLAGHCGDPSLKTVIVTGPELAELHKHEVRRLANRCSHVQVIEFTDQMMNYMSAADVVVAMAGYNTICEILSLRKRAVIVPRVGPVKEQEIRAERMARLGLFKMIHPARLTPRLLIEAVRAEVEALRECPHPPARIELDALPRISRLIGEMASRVAGGNGAWGKSFLAQSGR